MALTSDDLDAVLALNAPLLRRLPAAVTLDCRCNDIYDRPRRFWVTTSREHYSAAIAAHLPAANGHEWLALCLAAAAGRTRLALAQWLAPGYPLTLPPPWALHGSLYDLTGGVFRAVDRATAWDDIPVRVSVGGVLDHFGARLIAVDPPVGDAPRAARAGQGDLL